MALYKFCIVLYCVHPSVCLFHHLTATVACVAGLLLSAVQTGVVDQQQWVPHAQQRWRHSMGLQHGAQQQMSC